jgi:hypothetical protein
MSYLSKKGYVLKKETLSKEELAKLKLELKARPLTDDKFNFNKGDNSYPIYIETKTKIYIPKMFGINKYGIPPIILDNYNGKDWENPIEFKGSLLERQIEPVEELLKACKEKGGGILTLSTGFGKCHKIDTPILMFDGTIKKVQDIQVNELLMGDDSTPRKVLSLARGTDLMYDIIPVKGEKYTVNKEHILCLKISGKPSITQIKKYNSWQIKWFEDNKYKTKFFKTNEKNKAIEFLKTIKQQEIMEIAVKDYIKLPQHIKHVLKGYKVQIDFPEKQLNFDPYIIGLWLGDGTGITNQDSTIIHYLKKTLPKYNCYLQYNDYENDKYNYIIHGEKYKGENKSKRWIKHNFLEELKEQNLIGNKHIPTIYKCNSRENRLKLLAGLLDSDGNLVHDKCTFEIIQKSEKLIDDIIYLCRSLGFSCYKNKEKKGCWYKGIYRESDYFRICISGYGTHEIPTLCPRKKANVRKQIKNVLVTGITVEEVGVDNYYGFEIDNNRRYVLGDFTVTHNTFCGLYALSKLKSKAIIIVNKIPLMNQWKSEIETFLPNAKIGTIQGKKNVDIVDCDIVIAMLQSLARIDYPDELFNDFKAVIVDECFPYDTNIITLEGNINIGQLYYMKGRCENLPMVKTFNETTKQFEYKKIINVFRKQNDTLIEINCSKMKIKSTENHKYLTYNGWKEAIDLNTEDYIVSNYDKNTINTVCPALNNDQYQIVLGSFLGDGHIQLLKNGRYRLKITHCKAQYEYCKWKASMFNVNDITYIEKNGYSQKEAYAFNTKTFYLFNTLPTTKTYVPQWILDDLDEKGLAIWFMDDGSLNKKSFYSTISTDSFDEDSQKRIVLKLKSMNIDCKYVNYKKSYYHIVINENGTKELIRLISKYIHNNMLYKLLPRQYINYIQDMSIKILDKTTIFCKKENIKDELLIQNKEYKIYDNLNKDKFHLVKYNFCKKCNHLTFHNKYKIYWQCNHTSKDVLQNLPIIFGEYNWNNKFLDYGYSKITKITKNIKNFNKSKFKRNYVFDLEIEDNHNYIVKKRVSGDIKNGFVVHNCHNTPSEHFSKVLFKVCCKYTIGLSATPKRADGCEYVFKWHLGEIVFKDNVERVGLAPIIKLLKIDTIEYKEISTENRFTGAKTIQFTSMLSELVEMPKRNLLIVELIKDVMKDPNRKILVLSDRRTHLQNLKGILDADLSITFTYGLFLGSMKQADLTISRASNVILATYAAFSEGVSEKLLNCLIMVSPKKYIHLKTSIKQDSGKLKQVVGRIFRMNHIECNPIIIDLFDNFSVYKSQGNSRKIFYKEEFKNGIFEDLSIDLDDHEDVKIEYIKTKTKKTTTIKEVESAFNTCLIDN